MKICKQCGKTAENDGNFCENCGGVLVNAAFCPHCGSGMPEGTNICPACGKTQNEEEVQNENVVPTPESKPKHKLPLIIGIGAAVLAVAAIGTVALISGRKSPSVEKPIGLVYQNGDGKTYYLRNDKGETARLAKDGTYHDGYVIENGNTLLYSKDKTAYCLSLKDKDAKPKKIISRFSYTWSTGLLQFAFDGTVAYADDDGELFFGSYKKPESVDKDVTYFQFFADSGALAYITDDTDLYFMPKGHDAERASRDVRDFHISSDGNTVLFLDSDGDIYRKKYGKEKEKLASDAEYLLYANDNLSVFYYSDEDNTLYAQKGSKSPQEICDDAQIVGSDNHGTVFLADYRENRGGDLCIVGGKDYRPIEEDVISCSSWYNFDSLDIYRYSKENDEYDFLFVKNNQFKTLSELIDNDSAPYNFYFDEESDMLYLCDEYNLYSCSVASKLPEKASVISELPFDFDNYSLYAPFKGTPVVYGYDDGYGSDIPVALCRDGTKICEESIASVVSTEKYLYYITSENNELYRFDGKKSEFAAEDVYNMTCINDKLYYVADYNDETESGDLYVIGSSKKPVMIAEDVRSLDSVFSGTDEKTYVLFGY